MSKHKVASRLAPILAVGALAAAVGASCSAGGGNTTQGTGGSSSTTGSASGGAPSSSSGTGADDIGFDGGTTSASTGGLDPDAGCAGVATKAKLLPLDIYIMLDQSGSMLETIGATTQTKWKAVTGALQDFLTQPGLGTNGISVGIQYFGVPPSAVPSCPATCSSDADCGNYGPCNTSGQCVTCQFPAPDSCNPADYAKPAVEIAPLFNAQIVTLLQSFPQTPYGNTPTQAALQGAIDYAKAQASKNPDHVVVALFATDGQPTECTVQSATGLAQIAAEGMSATPSVRTFAIGVFGAADKPEGPNVLNAVAAAGGTQQAFVIDASNPNLQAEFLKALNSIRGSALGCQYKLPQTDAGMLNYNQVNVEYKPGGGTPEEFFKYNDAASCPATGNGWYYDNNNSPTQILLCPKTCDKVGKDTMGEVNIVLGCTTKLPT